VRDAFVRALAALRLAECSRALALASWASLSGGSVLHGKMILTLNEEDLLQMLESKPNDV
jgi:hypothetical protein